MTETPLTDQRWSIGRQLAEQLELDPDQPVVEWHTWGVPEAGEPEAVEPIPWDGFVMGYNPTGWWRLGETSGNIAYNSGSGSHGTAYYNGGPLPATVSRPGLVANSANTAADLTAPLQVSAMGLGQPSELTVFMLLKLAPAAASGTYRLFSRGGSYPISFKLVNGLLVADAYSTEGFTYKTATSAEVLPTDGSTVVAVTGRWKWGAGTAGYVEVYVNGAQTGTRATGLAGPGRTDGFGIGPVPAVVDEVAVWLTALTPAQIADLAAVATTGQPAGWEPPPPPPSDPTWVLDAERTAALSSYRVDYGRQAVTERTSALSASVALVAPLVGQLPTVGERFRLTISEPVATALGLADEDRPRFTGQVTDVDVDDLGWVSVVGIGQRGRLGRVTIGADKRWGAQLDGTRMRRVLTAVAEQLPQLDVGQLDPGTVQLLQRDPAAATADSIVDEVVTSSNGQLVEQRNGQLDWHDRDHRRGATVALTLDEQLLRPFRWAQGIGSVINRARVGWGTANPQGQVVVEHAASTDQATGLGPIETDVTTILANEADAYATGSDLVGRRAWPTWQLPSCTVELVRSVPAGPLRGQLLALRHGHLIHLAQLTPGGPYIATDAWVEGTQESCTRTSWSLTLHVSDYAQGGVSLRWVDIPEGVTWDQLDPALTWLDLATAEPTDLT